MILAYVFLTVLYLIHAMLPFLLYIKLESLLKAGFSFYSLQCFLVFCLEALR